jgi:hypothetical protein
MARFAIAAFGLMAAIGIASCATTGKPALKLPSTQITLPLTVLPDIPVLGRAVMPPGWEPVANRPPLWLRQGQEIVVIGTLSGRAMVFDLDAAGLRQPRVLAADQAGPDRVLADVAASPDASSIAIAVAQPGENRVEAIRYDLADHRGRSIASLYGPFETINLAWPDSGTVALAATSKPSKAAGEAAKPGAASLLYLIPSAGGGVPERIQLSCALSRLSWSPDGAYAIGQGAAGAAPIIIDRKKKTCRALGIAVPIRIVEWAPRSPAFLYVSPIAGSPVIGAFQFDVASGKSIPIAVSSSAASYLDDSTIAAIGNRGLTAQRLLEQSRIWTTAEIAWLNPSGGETAIATLGVRTLSDLLASSAMVYSPRSDTVAIELYVPGVDEPIRYFIAYPLATRQAVLLAQGPARGTAEMSWSPDGTAIALLAGDPVHSELIVLSPASAIKTTTVPQALATPGAVESPAPASRDTGPATR